LAIQEDITAHRTLEAQYLQSQKMEAIGRLAGGIAHDFNNMLAVILGYIDAVLLDMKPADPLYADLDQVRSAANRSAELTGQLLAFSRQQTIAPVVMDVNAQVQGIESLLQRLIGEDIRIRYTLDSKLWPIEMDPSQCDQILTNLAVNARDAMPGGGTLSIETSNVRLDEPVDPNRADFEPGDFVLLAISDTGCGMGPDMMGRLFEPFFTTKAPGKGTGLGLATLYGIVKQNGGHVNVYSEPDRGTTFRIYLPRCKGKANRAAAVPQSSGNQRGTETILLVEDDKMVRSLAKRVLERFGYTTLEAATPDEAIALCENHPGEIHLLLSDVVMPAMNGKELKERLSSLRPSLKTLYMSGYTADVIANRGILDKDTHFIAKPFSTAEIGKKVREVLDVEK
jgi:two-component system, cell cycle sensor histidine kinase and response regulator CckA